MNSLSVKTGYKKFESQFDGVIPNFNNPCLQGLQLFR